MSVTYHALKLAVMPSVDIGALPQIVGPTPPEGASTQQQQAWADEALGWTNLDPTPAHPLTPNSDTFIDFWEWADVARDDRYRGTRDVAFVQGTLQTYVDLDVVFMFVADPSPGHVALGRIEDFYFVRRAGDNTIEARIWASLDSPSRPPPYNTKAFFQQVIVQAMAAVIHLLLEESFGEGYVAARHGPVFGFDAALNTGPYFERTAVAAHEALKDMLFSGRQSDSKARKRLQGRWYRRFANTMLVDALFPPGPGEQVLDGAGLVQTYTVPFCGLPIPPRPKYVWGEAIADYDGPDDYDYPWLRTAADGLTFATKVGGGWYWGGDTAAHVGGNFGPWPLDPYRRPPEPGSKVRFRMQWFDPVAPVPTDPRMLCQDPATGDPLPPGVFGMDLGFQSYTDRFGVDHGGADESASIVGIVWGVAERGADTYTYVAPHEIQRGNTPTLLTPDIFGDVYAKIVPVYFDFNGPGVWEFELTVPDHGGELGLQFATTLPWFPSGGGVPGYPIRCHPPGMLAGRLPGKLQPLWSMFPRFAPAQPYRPGIGIVRAGKATTGQVQFSSFPQPMRVQGLDTPHVHFDDQAVTLIDGRPTVVSS